MSLKSIKQKLNIDQVNILTATVLSDGAKTVQIRTIRGEIHSAIKDPADSYTPGDRLEIRLAGNAVLITGPAPLATLAGEVVRSV